MIPLLDHFNLPDLVFNFSMREAAGATTKTSVLHTWTMDARRGADLPADGTHARLTQELAFGGDAHFHKLSGEARYGQALWPGTRLSVGATAGILQALSGSKTFFSDRFQLGGPVSVRSFRTNGMGPRDGGRMQFLCVTFNH